MAGRREERWERGKRREERREAWRGKREVWRVRAVMGRSVNVVRRVCSNEFFVNVQINEDKCEGCLLSAGICLGF